MNLGFVASDSRIDSCAQLFSTIISTWTYPNIKYTKQNLINGELDSILKLKIPRGVQNWLDQGEEHDR